MFVERKDNQYDWNRGTENGLHKVAARSPLGGGGKIDVVGIPEFQ